MKFMTSLYASSRLSEAIQSIDVATGCIAALRIYNDVELRQIQLVLAELVANAIEHGNKFDPDKSVGILVTVMDAGMEIEVTDEGPGIAAAVLDGVYHAGSARGRGLQIVKAVTGNLRIKNGHICTMLQSDKLERGR